MRMFRDGASFTLYIGLCCFGALLLGVDAKIVRWVPNTNTNNPKNWNTGHVPCSNEHVHFPSTSPTVFIQNNLTTIEIVLPNNGQFILGDSAGLVFPVSVSNDATCKETNVTFVGVEAKSWFDPVNWCEVSNVDGACLSPPPNRLDLERIPCSSDSVVFPGDASYLVQLENSVDIHVGMLTVANQAYTTQTFQRYLSSSNDGKQFTRKPGQHPTTITVLGNICPQTEPTGCACENSKDAAIHQLVCETRREDCNVTSLCDKPLAVDEHCCSFCGSVLLLEFGPSTRLQLIDNLAKRTLADQGDKKKEIKVYISKSHDEEHIQLVVMDSEGGDSAVPLGRTLKSKLEADMSDKNRYGITNIIIRESGPSHSSAQAQTGTNMGGGNIAGIVIGLIVLLLLVLLVIYCTSNRRRPLKDFIPSVPIFLRRGSADGRKRTADMELAHSVLFRNSVVFEGGIDNPNFDPALQREGAEIQPGQAQYRVASAASAAEGLSFDSQKGSFSNPLFGKGATPQYSKSEAAVISTSHASPLDDQASSAHSKSHFPQISFLKDDPSKQTPVKSILTSILSRGKHQRMAEDKAHEDEKIKSSQEMPDDKPERDINVTKSKSAKSAKKVAKEADTTGDTEAKLGEESKSKKAKIPASSGSQMHEKLVEDSSSSADQEMKTETKRDKKKKGGKKSKKVDEDVDSGDLSFGNPLYMREDTARIKWEIQDQAAKPKESPKKEKKSKEKPSSFANPLFEEKQASPASTTAQAESDPAPVESTGNLVQLEDVVDDESNA